MDKMTDSRAAEVLAAHNEWRRGGDGPQTDPTTLGLAIDQAIARLREPAGVGWTPPAEALSGGESPTMTNDIERLPMPKYPVDLAPDDYSYNTGWNDCLAECRANVSHATASKDAEIEALRAEVERLEDESQSRLEACGDAVSKLCAAEARAERLSEALRERRDWFETQAKSISKGNGSSWELMQVREQRELCDAALKQEAE